MHLILIFFLFLSVTGNPPKCTMVGGNRSFSTRETWTESRIPRKCISPGPSSFTARIGKYNVKISPLLPCTVEEKHEKVKKFIDPRKSYYVECMHHTGTDRHGRGISKMDFYGFTQGFLPFSTTTN